MSDSSLTSHKLVFLKRKIGHFQIYIRFINSARLSGIHLTPLDFFQFDALAVHSNQEGGGGSTAQCNTIRNLHLTARRQRGVSEFMVCRTDRRESPSLHRWRPGARRPGARLLRRPPSFSQPVQRGHPAAPERSLPSASRRLAPRVFPQDTAVTPGIISPRFLPRDRRVFFNYFNYPRCTPMRPRTITPHIGSTSADVSYHSFLHIT